MDASLIKLKQYLKLINLNLEISKIIKQKQSKNEIRKYYLVNHLAYLIFHNKQGFMHMGISRDGKYKKGDLLEPLRIINHYIKSMKAKRVLELGAGNGSNSVYLAKINTKTTFLGIDLSKKVLFRFRYRGIKNYRHDLGDYHNLTKYPNEQFDLIFAIEALCHSAKKKLVFGEVLKKLKRGGLFIIFDGYGSKRIKELTKEEKMAKKLTEKAMAINRFENINDFERLIDESGFLVVKKEDLTETVLPTMRRFEKLALAFYKMSLLTFLLKLLLPFNLVKNSIAGLLLPVLLERKVGCYFLHVLKKIY